MCIDLPKNAIARVGPMSWRLRLSSSFKSPAQFGQLSFMVNVCLLSIDSTYARTGTYSISHPHESLNDNLFFFHTL